MATPRLLSQSDKPFLSNLEASAKIYGAYKHGVSKYLKEKKEKFFPLASYSITLKDS
ncbi:hypothetical protein [Wolbachia endosymbiont of Brugia malayi]|uniref:hypothetical protein n=1 Tax=Wolbachia endosymbiont of Brugia malayi TaxID=80849 RepID=UPI0002FDA226|nr:hypothetical protein [Wolbachia endosymbiont of Brugia malayi]